MRLAKSWRTRRRTGSRLAGNLVYALARRQLIGGNVCPVRRVALPDQTRAIFGSPTGV